MPRRVASERAPKVASSAGSKCLTIWFSIVRAASFVKAKFRGITAGEMGWYNAAHDYRRAPAALQLECGGGPQVPERSPRLPPRGCRPRLADFRAAAGGGGRASRRRGEACRPRD